MRLEQNRDVDLAINGDPIGFYEREFYPFSNFSSFQVIWKAVRWHTAEHAYQAAKFMDLEPGIAGDIFSATSAHSAFEIARLYNDRVRADWADVKVSIMEDICRHKLEQHPYVQRKLLQTGDLYLVEDSPKDSFWGWGTDRKGRNELGKIWMRLRDEFVNARATGVDPYTLKMRLCDDTGQVSREPVVDCRVPFEPEGWTYLERMNRALRKTAQARGEEHATQVEKPFQCTGHAHLLGEHIRCTSPAHKD